MVYSTTLWIPLFVQNVLEIFTKKIPIITLFFSGKFHTLEITADFFLKIVYTGNNCSAQTLGDITSYCGVPHWHIKINEIKLKFLSSYFCLAIRKLASGLRVLFMEKTWSKCTRNQDIGWGIFFMGRKLWRQKIQSRKNFQMILHQYNKLCVWDLHGYGGLRGGWQSRLMVTWQWFIYCARSQVIMVQLFGVKMWYQTPMSAK